MATKGDIMERGFWDGFLVTLLFFAVIVAVLGGVFIVISLVSGLPGA
jgi:hypothetical protein